MRSLRSLGALLILASALLVAVAGGPLAAPAGAEGLQWRLEQPNPPEPEAGVKGSETPIGLGSISDIEFWAPNRGLLITDGNGSTVKPGVWAYNGEGWHELATVCGASVKEPTEPGEGRIAWAGENEFWTVSDGRPGQSANPLGLLPPLEDNTLCRFAFNPSTDKLEVVDSYASLAFKASSYQPMQAAACVSSTDCWFGGAPLESPQIGAFQLHWNGSSVQAEPNTRIHSVRDMRVFEGRLVESVGLPAEEAEGEQEEILHPSILQEVAPEGAAKPFASLQPRRVAEGEAYALPEYARGSYPEALGALRLSAAEGSLWAAAGPTVRAPNGSNLGVLTVLHQSNGEWAQVLGPEETGQENEPRESGSIAVTPPSLETDLVSSIATEPGSSSAWLALEPQFYSPGRPITVRSPTELASAVHVEADGQLAEEQLPTEAERGAGVGPKGAASQVVCPAQNDCWLATTQGWLFHLSEAGDRTLPRDNDPAFNGPLITYRPPDEGVPQVQGDAPPPDDSGLEETQPPSSGSSLQKLTTPNTFATVSVPLLSDVHSRLVHGTTLELSFHLAVKARVRLIAKRHSRVVASTPTRTFKAGKRSLQLRLNVHRWPTKLSLQTDALAPLPTTSTLSAGVETVSTSLAFPKALGITGWGPAF
jgi:hypothetical protein